MEANKAENIEAAEAPVCEPVGVKADVTRSGNRPLAAGFGPPPRLWAGGQNAISLSVRQTLVRTSGPIGELSLCFGDGR